MIRITVKVEVSSDVSTQKVHFIDDIELAELACPLQVICDKIRETSNVVIDAINNNWVERPHG